MTNQKMTEQKKTNWMNIGIAVMYILLMLGMGFINQDSSRTIWIVIPFFCLFLPIAWFAYGAYEYSKVKLPLTKEQAKHSVVRMRHSVVGILIISAISVVSDTVFILRCKVWHKTFNTTLGQVGIGESMRLVPELLYLGGFLLFIALSIAFAKIYDKYYAKNIQNS